MTQTIKNIVAALFGNKDHKLARDMVRYYFRGHNVDFKTECNGTVRFTVDGFKLEGFYRLRKIKDRGLGASHVNSFDQIHIGKLTIAVERKAGRQLWNFATAAH